MLHLLVSIFFTNSNVKQNEYRFPGARATFLICTLLDSLLTPPVLFVSALCWVAEALTLMYRVCLNPVTLITLEFSRY